MLMICPNGCQEPKDMPPRVRVTWTCAVCETPLVLSTEEARRG